MAGTRGSLTSFQHLIQTRFSVRFPWGFQEFPLPWLEERLMLFDAYCLPSIKAQTCQNFTWLVYCDEDTDQNILTELKNRERDIPQMRVMLTAGKRGFREVTDDVINPAAQALVTTRLDSDDAIHMDYVESIQTHLLDFVAMGSSKWLLNFPRGYRMNQETQKLYLDWEPRSPFHSLFERDVVRAQTVLMGNHSTLHRQYPTTQDDSLAAWLVVIHGGNAENQLRGYYTGEARAAQLAEFGIGLDSLSRSAIPMPILEKDAPIALRPLGDFAARQASVFDDPGDEKSWHASQRAESLTTYYKGREPSWYASAIQPLEDADRVLDLGCGPGLALRALLDQGTTSVLGIDRWPHFFEDTSDDAPVIAHDLTLPMPFIESGSFDGVLSHFVLDYVSPIGMRQVLREAYRTLAPEGKLALYVAAIGLATGDDTRTVPYSPSVLTRLLEEAGFDEINVEAPSNRRNSIVEATRGAERQVITSSSDEASSHIVGETQLSAAFNDVSGDKLRIELIGKNRNVEFSIALPCEPQSEDRLRVALCARLVSLSVRGVELQTWVWAGINPIAAERMRLDFSPTLLRVRCDGRLEYQETWAPKPVSTEPPGNAYVSSDDLAPDDESSQPELSPEGRRLVVQPRSSSWSAIAGLRGKRCNRLLIRRPEHGLEIAGLDSEWLAGGLHGIVLDSADLADRNLLSARFWAGQRQALLLVEGADWETLVVATANHISDLAGPVVLVDPVLTGSVSGPVPEFALGHLVEANSRLYVILAASTREQLTVEALQQLQPGLLHGGPPLGDAVSMEDANEALRYLTERTLLMRLRQRYRRSPRDVGRRPSA